MWWHTIRIYALWRLGQEDQPVQCSKSLSQHEIIPQILNKENKNNSKGNLISTPVSSEMFIQLTNINLLNSCLNSHIWRGHGLHEGVEVTGNDSDNQGEVAVTVKFFS